MTPDELAARTPAEAKRHWMIDRMWLGSLFSFVALLFLVVILWLGGWSSASEGRRLNVLGMVAAMLLTRLIIVDLSFSLGGPVGRWRARWGNRSLGADSTDEAQRRAYDGGA